MPKIRTFTPRYKEYRDMLLRRTLPRSAPSRAEVAHQFHDLAKDARENNNLADACYYLIQVQNESKDFKISLSKDDKTEWEKFFNKHHAKFLSDIILENAHSLDISEMRSDINTDKYIKSLIHVIQYSKCLEVLYLHSDISLPDTRLLANAAMLSSTLKKLFVGLGFTITEFDHILTNISNNKTLELLDLSGTSLNMETVAHLLKENTTLKELYLDSCFIKDSGAITLAHGLKHNRSLTTLKLFLNEISDAGIIALTEAIKTHPNLTHIDVSTNSFSSEGQQALIELAKLKPHLTIHNPQYDLTQENQQNLGRNTHGC